MVGYMRSYGVREHLLVSKTPFYRGLLIGLLVPRVAWDEPRAVF